MEQRTRTRDENSENNIDNRMPATKRSKQDIDWDSRQPLTYQCQFEESEDNNRQKNHLQHLSSTTERKQETLIGGNAIQNNISHSAGRPPSGTDHANSFSVHAGQPEQGHAVGWIRFDRSLEDQKPRAHQRQVMWHRRRIATSAPITQYVCLPRSRRLDLTLSRSTSSAGKDPHHEPK